MIKALVKSALSALGFELRRKQMPRGWHGPYLSQLCKPRTVFDVGVGFGTTELYRAYPGARLILIEPLEEYQAALREIAASYDCRIYRKAIGRHPGTVTINVDKGNPELSSVTERTALTVTGNPIEKRLVEVTTLDEILEENPDLEAPMLLKIDVEGQELECLMGATRLLERCEVAIVEVSVARRFEQSYAFSDLVRFMHQQDFEAFDILDIDHVGGGPGALFADIVFRRGGRG